MNKKHLLVGCSFTDPIGSIEAWYTPAFPWSIPYSKQFPSYIVARSGMGIKGICTEALYYIQNLDVSRVIIVLPTLWRMDIEVDQETYLANAIVDLLYADRDQAQHYKIDIPGPRKWIISGGFNYEKDREYSKIFDFLYKHQGFLVILKEHIRALTRLLDYCKLHNIEYAISAIQDPMDQLTGLDYIRDEICTLLDSVEYNSWIRFDGKFIDQYLGHPNHPTTEEHQVLCRHIIDNFK